MKRIKYLLSSKPGIATTLIVTVLVVSATGAVYDTNNIFLILAFGASLMSGMMLFVSKNGKFPFISSDTVWHMLWFKGEDEREAMHNNASLSVATIAFAFMIPLFVIGVAYLIMSELMFN